MVQKASLLLCLFFWSTNSNSVPIIGHNGNAYEYVLSFDISWSDANITAMNSSYLGANGHLATIQSEQENVFVLGLLSDIGHSVWLGGTDSVVEGEWRWVTGEQFWAGGIDGTVGPDSLYTNWVNGINPSNSYSPASPGGEDYLTMFGGLVGYSLYSGAGLWNDMPITSNNPEAGFTIGGYVVEYEISSIPIPSAAWLFGSGLLGLIGLARRKANA